MIDFCIIPQHLIMKIIQKVMWDTVYRLRQCNCSLNRFIERNVSKLKQTHEVYFCLEIFMDEVMDRMIIDERSRRIKSPTNYRTNVMPMKIKHLSIEIECEGKITTERKKRLITLINQMKMSCSILDFSSNSPIFLSLLQTIPFEKLQVSDVAESPTFPLLDLELSEILEINQVQQCKSVQFTLEQVPQNATVIYEKTKNVENIIFEFDLFLVPLLDRIIDFVNEVIKGYSCTHKWEHMKFLHNGSIMSLGSSSLNMFSIWNGPVGSWNQVNVSHFNVDGKELLAISRIGDHHLFLEEGTQGFEMDLYTLNNLAEFYAMVMKNIIYMYPFDLSVHLEYFLKTEPKNYGEFFGEISSIWQE